MKRRTVTGHYSCAAEHRAEWQLARPWAGCWSRTVALWAVSTAVIGLVGTSPRVGVSLGAAAFYALALASNAVMFGAVGALASQIASTRRGAATAGGIILGLGYGVRMVADSASGLHWSLWLSPLGWVELLRPLSDPEPVALLPIAALITIAAGAAIHLHRPARRRRQPAARPGNGRCQAVPRWLLGSGCPHGHAHRHYLGCGHRSDSPSPRLRGQGGERGSSRFTHPRVLETGRQRRGHQHLPECDLPLHGHPCRLSRRGTDGGGVDRRVDGSPASTYWPSPSPESGGISNGCLQPPL